MREQSTGPNAGAEIRELVRRLNGAWVQGRLHELDEIFHENMVLVAPDFTHRVVGREACIQTYRDFNAQAVVRDFELQDADVDVVGSTAVAACPYTLEYELAGKRWRGSGRDLLVLTRNGPGWLVVWRTLLAGPETEVDT